jgi:hypothetical protein
MGKHRLDRRDGDRWGGPDLISALDGQQPTTHSTSGQATVPSPAAGSSPADQGDTAGSSVPRRMATGQGA